ncbi:hypothetical protein ACM1RC_28245 [Paenibacillus azoreducens]
MHRFYNHIRERSQLKLNSLSLVEYRTKAVS